MICGFTREELEAIIRKCGKSRNTVLCKGNLYDESKDGTRYIYCKACKCKGHPGKSAADHPSRPDSRDVPDGQKRLSSTPVCADIILERTIGDQTFETKIRGCIVDAGYSGTICFQPKYARELRLNKRKVLPFCNWSFGGECCNGQAGFIRITFQRPVHKISLADGSLVDEYAYALPKSKGMGVVRLEVPITDPVTKKKKTKCCLIEKVFHDSKQNIVGADVLARMTLRVEAGKGVVQGMAYKAKHY